MHPDWLDLAGRFALVLVLTTLYYGVASDRLGLALTRRLVGRFGAGKRAPLSDRESTAKVIVAAAMQAAFLVVLIVVTRVDTTKALALGRFQPAWLLYGLLLGLGEMALSVSLSNIVIQGLKVVAPAGGPQSMDGWMVLLQGGWMKDFLRTTRVVPLPVAFALFMAYVAVEEVLFRGVLLTFFAPAGPALAVAGSVLVFAIVQAFGMPSWRSAMFPVTGALLVGTVHGALFLAVPSLWPLIVSHSVFVVMMYADPARPARFDYH